MNQYQAMECLEEQAGMEAGPTRPAAHKRGQFTFYASFYQALCTLPKSRQLEAYQAIVQYALYGVEPSVSGVSKSVFALVRPVLDASRSKSEARLRKQAAERGADAEENAALGQ